MEGGSLLSWCFVSKALAMWLEPTALASLAFAGAETSIMFIIMYHYVLYVYRHHCVYEYVLYMCKYIIYVLYVVCMSMYSHDEM